VCVAVRTWVGESACMCQRPPSPTFRSSVFSNDEGSSISQPTKRDVSPTFRSSLASVLAQPAKRDASPTFRSSLGFVNEGKCTAPPAKRDVSPTFRSSICLGDPNLCNPLLSPRPRSSLHPSRCDVPEGKAARARSGSPRRSSSPPRRSDSTLSLDQTCGASGSSIATACWQRFCADSGSSTQEFCPCQVPSPSRSRCKQRMTGIHEVGGDSYHAWTRIGNDFLPIERPIRVASPGKRDTSDMRNILQGTGHRPCLSGSQSGDKLPQKTRPPWLHLDACSVQSESNTRRSPKHSPRHVELDGSAVSCTLNTDGHIDGTKERLRSPRAHCGKDSVRNLNSNILMADECTRTHTAGAILQDWQVIHSPRSRLGAMNAQKNASNGLSSILAHSQSMPSAGIRSSEMTAGSSVASGNMSPRELTPERHRRELRADAVRQWDAAVNPDRPANVPLSDRARARVLQRRGY